METTTAKHVYQAINAVTAIMAREGIAKTRRNKDQNYAFRGIDDVYAALSGHLAANKLCMLPRVVERSCSERVNKNGTVLSYTVVIVDFDFVSAVDGSTHTIRTAGEAMDSSDKSTNKAQSAAMKYACLMAFQIPTEGDNDADAHDPRASGSAPSLERQLAASVDLVEWEKLAQARLLSAPSMADLKETWAIALEEGRKKGAPAATMARLSAVKDQCKSTFAPANSNAAAQP